MKNITKTIPLATMMLAAAVVQAGQTVCMYESNEPVTVVQGMASTWATKVITISTGVCYRVELETKSSVSALVASLYDDADGKAVVSDNYNLVRPSSDWKAVSWYFQAPPQAASGQIVVAVNRSKEFQIRHIRVDQVDRGTMRAWQISELAALPSICFTPAAARWKALPRTPAVPN